MRYLIATCGFLCAASQLHSCYAASEHAALVIQGDSYPGSCDAAQKKLLHEELVRSEAADAKQAWQVVELILCASDSAANRDKVISLLRKKIRQTIESTGSQPIVGRVAGNVILVDNLMAAGRAWNSSVSGNETRIVLQYFVDEACVNSVTLLYDEHKWSVDEIGQACD
jgi:chitinase